ncbi:MAG: Mov34/MPN/PAD-1 family protein [Planctomycetota bacterium]
MDVFASLQRVLKICQNHARNAFVARRPTLPEPTSFPKAYRRLERIVLTEGVVGTLFDDFDRHRETARGEEEFGWVLLGVREETEAVVLAALPAGAQRHASLTHIQFHSNAQTVATRWLRQTDKRLAMLGVAHTHPGSMRHPSGGDYRGDIQFVARLRGREGVFAIGTADASFPETVTSSEPHRHGRGSLCMTWYALAEGDPQYRKIPIATIAGDDLARPLAGVWPTLDTHADGLERLCQQLNGGQFGVTAAGLSFAVPLADDRRRLRVLLEGPQIRYYVEDEGNLLVVDPEAVTLEQGIYAILAELARRRLPDAAP